MTLTEEQQGGNGEGDPQEIAAALRSKELDEMAKRFEETKG